MILPYQATNHHFNLIHLICSSPLRVFQLPCINSMACWILRYMVGLASFVYGAWSHTSREAIPILEALGSVSISAWLGAQVKIWDSWVVYTRRSRPGRRYCANLLYIGSVGIFSHRRMPVAKPKRIQITSRVPPTMAAGVEINRDLP